MCAGYRIWCFDRISVCFCVVVCLFLGCDRCLFKILFSFYFQLIVYKAGIDVVVVVTHDQCSSFHRSVLRHTYHSAFYLLFPLLHYHDIVLSANKLINQENPPDLLRPLCTTFQLDRFNSGLPNPSPQHLLQAKQLSSFQLATELNRSSRYFFFCSFMLGDNRALNSWASNDSHSSARHRVWKTRVLPLWRHRRAILIIKFPSAPITCQTFPSFARLYRDDVIRDDGDVDKGTAGVGRDIKSRIHVYFFWYFLFIIQLLHFSHVIRDFYFPLSTDVVALYFQFCLFFFHCFL